MTASRFGNRVSKIERRYDPENDISQPEVSWVEYELLLMVLELESRISDLEEAVRDFERAELMGG